MIGNFKTRKEAFPRTIYNDPLLYAILIIERYQAAIREAKIHGDAMLDLPGERNLIPVGGHDTLADAGFCQEEILLEAIPRIKGMAGIEGVS